MNMKPVMFPPGCAKLETKPCSTGSLTAAITIGMELVACRRAWTTGVVLPMITSGASATSSAASARMRLASAPAKRVSISMLRPSIHPNS